MFRKNSIITFGTRIISFGLQIMRSIVAARALGPYGRGILGIIYTSVQIVFMILESGITLANVYHIGKKKYADSEIFTNSLFTSFLFGSLGAVSFILWYRHDPMMFGSFDPRFMVIAAAMIPFSLCTQYNASLFQGKNMLGRFNIIKITEPLIFFIAFIVLVEFARLEVAGAVYANVIGHIFALGVSFWAVLRLRGIRIQFNRSLFPASLKFGLKGHIGSIGGYLNNRFDVFMVNFYTDVEYVGFYVIAVVVAESLLYIPNSLAQVLFPIVASRDRENIHQFSATVCRNTLALCSAGGLLLWCIADFLVPAAFGREFAEAVVPLKILIPGVVFLSIVKITNSHLVGIGRPSIPSVISWTMFLINIPTNVLLIPKFGIAGAALASTFSYGIGMFVSVAIFSEIAGVGLLKLLIVQRSDFVYYCEYLQKVQRKLLS